MNPSQPGHEYTKANVRFGLSVLQSEAVRALDAFADANKETQGKFTISDEKKHNVFMRPQVSSSWFGGCVEASVLTQRNRTPRSKRLRARRIPSLS